MKKIFAISLAWLMLSSMVVICAADQSEAVQVEKKVWDTESESWVDGLHVDFGETVRFNITVTYHDWDGSGKGYELLNITITDILPDGLDYVGGATRSETEISGDGRYVIWNLSTDVILEDGDSYYLEFNVLVSSSGSFVNTAEIYATETCYGEPRFGEATATVYTEYDYRSRDVDADGNDEKAIDYNFISGDGYETYEDPDGSSDAVKSIDGDDDNKIDHFVDIDEDTLPEKYWDPDEDEDVLSDVEIIDVDYDSTDEWVYDSDGDNELDKYYDPDDDTIYPYVVYLLSIEIIGNGDIIVAPDGELFLQGFEVQLDTVADSGWNFDHWSGDFNGDGSSISIVMDSDKTITAHFTQGNGNPPTVSIIKPEKNSLYVCNIRLIPLPLATRIIGPITVNVEAESEKGIDRVEFYLDDESKGFKEETGLTGYYSWTWFFKPVDLKNEYTIKVIAYDTEGSSSSEEIVVYRYRIPIIALGLLSKILSGSDEGSTDDGDQKSPEPDTNDAPSADANGPYNGTEGTPIEFDGSKSNDPDGYISDYTWDFGDGTIAHGRNPTHTYLGEGEYTVMLTVTDSDGASDTDMTKATVSKLDAKSDVVDDDNDLFWYIVIALSAALLTLLGILYLRRKYYV
ncbi:MAG: PKD domain-containing protein [Thermoplasmatales archaeon]|nr:MAG: PKD domain-containing protein [Thermoplasmatales archaeon]